MQIITFDGRLGKDAEISTTKGGTKYVRFSVANNTFNNGTEKTEWYDVTSYDPFVVEKRAQYLTKGTYVIVSGPVRFDVSVKDGRVWRNLYVNANSIDTPSFGKKDAVDEQAEGSTAAPAATTTQTAAATPDLSTLPGIPSTYTANTQSAKVATAAAQPTYQPSYAASTAAADDSDLPF